MLEKDMKDDFFWYLDMSHEKIRVMEEIVIGKSRADVAAVLPDRLVGYELKSNGDSYARLPSQTKSYDKYFDCNYLVVGETHSKHAAEHVPPYWGIIVIPDVGNEITVLREAGPNPNVKMRWQLSLLWRSELMSIRLRHGLHKYADKSKLFCIKYMIEKLDADTLRRELCNELFERDYDKFI